jgi:two-component system chemotaxis response regulator CheB
MKIRVLVVDDSAIARSALTRLLEQGGDIEVVGTAADASAAEAQIERLKPDVVTLDIEMPHTNGLEFLEQMMKKNPVPTVVISAYAERNSDTTFRALELGAVDFVTKPGPKAPGSLLSQSEEIRDKVRAAWHARQNQPARYGAEAVGGTTVGGLDAATQRDRLVLIGASTGGTEAIKEVLTALPAAMPGILVVQHMPEMFTGSFARRLDTLCKITVKEAVDGERVLPGHAYIAPGHSHLSVRRSAGGWYCELARSEPVNRHRPSVDVLFDSAAKHVGAAGIGVMLTGMGKDGAQGMLAMHKAGAWNIGQDQNSCVVYGMPREAALIGALDEVSTLREIPLRIQTRLRQPIGRHAA